MKIIKFFFQFPLLLLLLASFLPWRAFGQCDYQRVEHLSGTQQVGCSSVTVTSEGSVSTISNLCGTIGPYWIGQDATGSYTFNFSPAISVVKINLANMDNHQLGLEELSFEINGSFYPIVNPVALNACPEDPIVIMPSGTLQACSNCFSGCNDLVITGNINSLKIEDIYLFGSAAGTVVELFICCSACQTDAGQITAGPLNLCPGNTAIVPEATQTFLEAGDLLRYILFSNPNDTLGSILATSVNPNFAFNPSNMATGETYYVAAIAGNNLNGNVDLNDPCLDISNAALITWRPAPSVIFSVANPNVCAGNCRTVTAIFTGTAPFTLTYSTPASGPVTQPFSTNSSTFQVCPPVGALAGSLVVQATALEDAWCGCP